MARKAATLASSSISRRSTASIGGASEITMLADDAASIWATRVEPQRDMWKTSPSGGRGWRSSGPGRDVRRPTRRFSGR
jgi:hypothetical protein